MSSIKTTWMSPKCHKLVTGHARKQLTISDTLASILIMVNQTLIVQYRRINKHSDDRDYFGVIYYMSSIKVIIMC